MNVLTPTEISECLTGGPTAVARAIESAVIRRMAAGASVEPVGVYSVQRFRDNPEMTNTDFQEYVDFEEGLHQLYTSDAIAAARVQAYDECTKLCDPDALGLEQGDDCATGVYRVEKAIRALKEKQE